MTAAAAQGQDGFVHLHVHTEYSMLDGAARLKDMFAECERAGMPAVAMTDHGNLYGAYDFWSKATKAGHQADHRHRGLRRPRAPPAPPAGALGHPGAEGRRRVRRRRLHAHDAAGRDHRGHAQPVPAVLAGLAGRATSASRGWTGNCSPRTPRGSSPPPAARAARCRPGSGSASTRRPWRRPRPTRTSSAPGNFFVEIMDHGLSIEQRVRDGLRRIARELDLPFVVTNDSHYAVEADAKAHEVLLCVQTGSNMADPGRFKFDGTGYYLKSPQEMRALFTDEEWQSGCDSTLLIAERADVTFQPKNLMPSFDLPDGETEESWLRKEVWRGMDRRYPDGYDERRRQQVEYEIGIITQMGFCSYFLVVADFIMWAKRNGVGVGPGRGSAAGCLVAYALGITDLDPLQHGLIFERFLNPERVSMPDIDIDFDERRRGDVIRYVTEKWGEDRVAQIITYGTIKAKAAVKDAARVLGFPYALGDRITKAFPPAVMGKDIPLAGIFDETHPRYGEAGEIRALYEAEAEVRQVIDTARGLEGLIRQAGVHAAGVIMSSEPIIDHVPVWKRRGRRRGHHPVRLPGLRVARPAQDGLPRPAQPDRAGRRGPRRQVQPGHRGRPECAAAGRQAHLRPAGPGRHAGHLPVRRRADAGAAAQHAAGQLRGHLRGRRAVPARPDGRQRAQRVRGPEEPAQAGGADPSRTGRAAGRDPGRHLRADRLPGAGHGDRAEGGRVQPGQRGPAPPGHGQEEKGDPGQGVQAVRGRDEGQRLLRRGDQDACGTSWSRSPTTRSTRRTAPPTAWCPTGPPTSRRTTRPSTWPRCSPRSPGTRTRAPCT